MGVMLSYESRDFAMASLRFRKSSHMSKAGLEMGVDAVRRRLFSFRACSL